jgi:hypothetical protein
MAIEDLDKWNEDEKSSDDRTKESQGIFENPRFDDETLGVQKLYDKVAELTDLINAHATKVAANDAKVTFPGLGTSNKTTLAGNTTVISSAQASAITANTAKVSLAGGSKTAISFGEMITTTTGKGKLATTVYTIVMTAVNGGVSKAITLTLT